MQEPPTGSPADSAAEPLQSLMARHSRELEAQATERRLRETELDHEKRLLRTVIDLLPDYIYVKDRQSRFLVDNLAVASNLGCRSDEVIGKTDFDFFPKELAEQFFADEQRVMATGDSLISREEPNYYPLTNTWGWHLTTTIPLRDAAGEIIGLVGVSRDISAHKQMEEALRENLVHQKVARQLLDSQEQERQRIAGELHDDLGQNLLIVKNKLMFALRAAMNQQDPTPKIEEAMGLVSQALQDVRTISHNLRPHQLDELGLEICLEGLVRRLGQSSGLTVTTAVTRQEHPVPPEVAINLYRITQESLSNVLKHAGANRVALSLAMTEGCLQLSIEDDGKGFDPAPFLKGTRPEEGFGLKVMSERAHLLGGTLLVDSRPSHGTRLTVTLPAEWRHDGDTGHGPDRG
jgi:two-component system, NarL family, sensor histidine kinase UhpB